MFRVWEKRGAGLGTGEAGLQILGGAAKNPPPSEETFRTPLSGSHVRILGLS